MDYERHPYTRVPEALEPETKDHEQIAARETPEAKLFDHEIELAIDRILESGILPPPELVPTGAMVTLTDENIDEQLPILEALADQCYRDGSFSPFPTAIVTKTGMHVERIIVLAQKLKNPVITADHKEQLPLTYVGAHVELPDRFYHKGKGWERSTKGDGIADEHIIGQLEQGGVAVFQRDSFLLDHRYWLAKGPQDVHSTSKLLLGDREQFRGLLSFNESLLADNAEKTLGRCQGVWQEEWASLSHLLARGSQNAVWPYTPEDIRYHKGPRRIDVFIAAAASGIHFEYLAKGFFQGLRDLGHDVVPPYFMGIWEKLKQFARLSDEELMDSPFRRMLLLCPTYEEYHEYRKTHQYEDDNFDRAAPLIYHILDQVTRSLGQAFDQRGNRITVGIFDESFNSGRTYHRMETFVQAAIHRICRERGEKETEITFEYLPAMTGQSAYGRYPTWQGKFVDVQHKAGVQSERVIRPSPKELPQAHALHRVFMALAQESGRLEARFLDQVQPANPVLTEQKQFVAEIEELYRAPARVHDSE